MWVRRGAFFVPRVTKPDPVRGISLNLKFVLVTHSMQVKVLKKLTLPALLKKFSIILWNPKIHNHVHKSPPLVSILNHKNPVNDLPSYLRFILTSSSYLRQTLFKWSISLGSYDNVSNGIRQFRTTPCQARMGRVGSDRTISHKVITGRAWPECCPQLH